MPVSGPVDLRDVCHSELVPCDVQRTVKVTEDINVSVVFHEIGDAVMTVQKDAHMA